MSDATEVQFIEDMSTATEFQLKHTPAVVVEGSPESPVLSVSIGLAGLTHPQTEEHFIEWIAVFDGDVLLDKVTFEPTETPTAVFGLTVPVERLIVQSYCNLHGTFGTLLG